MKTNHRSFRTHRGSLLIVAMILCAVIGISLASYLSLGKTGMTISNRALYNNGAMNLAENGMEQAVYAVNKKLVEPTYSFTDHGWTAPATDAWQKWAGYSFGQGATGEVRVYIYNYNVSAAPKIVTRSVVTLGGASTRTIEKWIEVQLRKTSKFSNGMVAKNRINFSGGAASVDSWNSDPDNNPLTIDVPIPYSVGVRRSNGSVGSISVAVDAVGVNNADIFGYASTGGALPSVGATGLVGTYGPPQTAAGTMDTSRVSTDFAASFDAVTPPTTYAYNPYVGAITTNVTLPRTVGTIDPMSADGKYYIEVDSVVFNNATLTIAQNVVLKVTNTIEAIKIAGSGELSIAAGKSLVIYASGSIAIGGGGVLNGGTTAATANPPANFQIYGTKTSGTQAISLKGNGTLAACVYAPQGDVDINGTGDVLGSIVANNINVTGNSSFHYDEALANLGGINPYRVSKWKELTTATERTAYASVLEF
jgi:hypothetical protein